MSSIFEVKIDAIRRACDNALAAVKSYREAAFESAVRAAIPRRFFRDRTQAEAEVYVRSEKEFGFPVWVFGMHRTESYAERLGSALARAEGTTAWLDAGDAAFVAKWEDS